MGITLGRYLIIHICLPKYQKGRRQESYMFCISFLLYAFFFFFLPFILSFLVDSLFFLAWGILGEIMPLKLCTCIYTEAGTENYILIT